MNLSKIKITALSLALFLVLSFVLSPVYAIESDIQTISENADINTNITTILTESDVPEVLDFSEAKNKGHISRERELEEDLFTAIFANDDGTNTMYIFGAPIKYIDNNGEIKDKSTKLSLSGTELITADNDVTVSFPQYASQGISVSKENINISMAPNYVSASADARIAEQTSKTQYGNKVTYRNAFGSNIHLSYTATFSGVKEDIILDSYTDFNEFTFIINTNGLYMVKNSNGSCSFIDPSTDSVKAEMMQVFCVDASNQFGGGDIEITEVKANQKYIITVIPDKEFLQSETTVYPVTVDPTIIVKTSTTIEDAAIYSGKPTTNYGSARTSTLGYVDSTYQKGELLVKFPTLLSNNVFSQLTAGDIVSATFSFYTTSSYSSTATIKAYISPISWYESSVTWNSLYPVMIAPTYISSTTVPSYIGSLNINLDITNAVKGWSSGSYDIGKGLLLCNSNESTQSLSRGFLNMEYSSVNSGYSPELSITYISSAEIALYGIPSTTHDHSSCLQTVKNNFTSGYWTDVALYTSSYTATILNYNLLNCNVFIIRTHGQVHLDSNKNQIGTYIYTDQYQNYKLYSHFTGTLPTGNASLGNGDYSNLDIVLFIGCTTAAGGSNGPNLVSKIVELGAETAIGFSDQIDCAAANKWTQAFVGYLTSGYTVNDALSQTSSLRDSENKLNSIVVCGNINNKLD